MMMRKEEERREGKGGERCESTDLHHIKLYHLSGPSVRKEHGKTNN
jgi:hypothetical protein